MNLERVYCLEENIHTQDLEVLSDEICKQHCNNIHPIYHFQSGIEFRIEWIGDSFTMRADLVNEKTIQGYEVLNCENIKKAFAGLCKVKYLKLKEDKRKKLNINYKIKRK